MLAFSCMLAPLYCGFAPVDYCGRFGIADGKTDGFGRLCMWVGPVSVVGCICGRSGQVFTVVGVGVSIVQP